MRYLVKFNIVYFDPARGHETQASHGDKDYEDCHDRVVHRLEYQYDTLHDAKGQTSNEYGEACAQELVVEV